MWRGEVWWVSFGASAAGEIPRRRPAVIISNDLANRHLNRVQVVPLSIAGDGPYPSEAYVTLDGRQHKAMADQIATVSKGRLGDMLGRLSAADLRQVEQIVKLQLGLLS